MQAREKERKENEPGERWQDNYLYWELLLALMGMFTAFWDFIGQHACLHNAWSYAQQGKIYKHVDQSDNESSYMQLWKSILELAWNFWMKLFFGGRGRKFLVNSLFYKGMYWLKVNFLCEGFSSLNRLPGQNKIKSDSYLELNSSLTVMACTWYFAWYCDIPVLYPK